MRFLEAVVTALGRFIGFLLAPISALRNTDWRDPFSVFSLIVMIVIFWVLPAVILWWMIN